MLILVCIVKHLLLNKYFLILFSFILFFQNMTNVDKNTFLYDIRFTIFNNVYFLNWFLKYR